MADVRINQVSTDLTFTDATSMMTPAMKTWLVQTVTKEVQRRLTEDRAVAKEQRLGNDDHDTDVKS